MRFVDEKCHIDLLYIGVDVRTIYKQRRRKQALESLQTKKERTS